MRDLRAQVGQIFVALNRLVETAEAEKAAAERERDRPYYETALICLNGHVLDTAIEGGPPPARRCPECGAETRSTCEGCGKAIHGHLFVPGVLGGDPYQQPTYCHDCGAAYPWTTRRLEALRELIREMDGLSGEERERLALSLDDLIAETPKTEVAVIRLKKALTKVGAEAAAAAKRILVDIASQTVKKSLGI